MHTYVHVCTDKERRRREDSGREKNGKRKGGKGERGKGCWYILILMSSHHPVFENAKVELGMVHFIIIDDLGTRVG